PASTASRQRSSTSPSGYTTFPCWRGSGRSVKYSRKTTASLNAPHSPGRPSIAAPQCESEEHHRFSDWGCCHAFLHPIALHNSASAIAPAFRKRYVPPPGPHVARGGADHET